MGKRLTAEPAMPARSSVQDVYGSGVQLILSDNGYSNDDQQQQHPIPRLRRHASNTSLDNVALKNQPALHSRDNDKIDGDATMTSTASSTPATMMAPTTESMTKLASFANLNRQNSEKGINFTYTEQERDEAIVKSNIANKKHGQTNGNGFAEKKTTFATLPNTTTWQQQSNQQNQQNENQSVGEFIIFILFYISFLFLYVISS